MADLREFRIAGPPGCGKTTTLSRMVGEACREYGSEGVIAASFTRTAARELVSRDLPLNDSQVGTLHALCYRSLDHPKIVQRKGLSDWNASHPSWPFEGGGTPDLDDPYGDPDMSGKQDGDRLLEQLNRLRGLQVPGETWPMRLQSFAEAWSQFKAETHTIDFTDLIEHCIKERVPVPLGAAVLFLDEVQDFSPLELALARQWGQQCEKVYLVGDEDQCLYGFKGCTPDAFLYPELPPEQVSVLGQSYRVPRAVHATAVAWVEGITKRMPKEYKPRDFEGEVDQLPITYRYLDPLRDRLERWIEEGKTVALLASCSFFIDPVKHKLREWGVPYHNPYRRTRGDWNPLQAKNDGIVCASERVLAFQKVAMNKGGAWWTYRDLWHWAAPLESDGVFAHGAKTAMRRKAEDETTMGVAVAAEDLESWISDPLAPDAAMAGDIGWFRQHVLKTHEKPIGYACNILEHRGHEALRKKPQVIIGTIHSVKGGEADIVVLFPDLSPAGYREWSSPGDGQDGVRRCFYVGITRAREALYWAQPSGMSIGGYL